MYERLKGLFNFSHPLIIMPDSSTPSPVPIQDHVESEVVHIQQGGAQHVEATTVTVEQGAIQQARADRITVENGGVGTANAQHIEITNGGVGLAQADHLSLQEAQAFVVAGKQVEATDVQSVFFLAKEVHGDVEAVITAQAAALGGLVFASVLTLFGFVLFLFGSKRLLKR